jgi:hypothetical protein
MPVRKRAFAPRNSFRDHAERRHPGDMHNIRSFHRARLCLRVARALRRLKSTNPVSQGTAGALAKWQCLVIVEVDSGHPNGVRTAV